MIMPEKKQLYYKAQTLRIIDRYSGIEVCDAQLVQDAQIAHGINTKPDDVLASLYALKDDGLVTRRVDDVRGTVWKVTPEGHIEAAKLALENPAE